MKMIEIISIVHSFVLIVITMLIVVQIIFLNASSFPPQFASNLSLNVIISTSFRSRQMLKAGYNRDVCSYIIFQTF